MEHSTVLVEILYPLLAQIAQLVEGLGLHRDDAGLRWRLRKNFGQLFLDLGLLGGVLALPAREFFLLCFKLGPHVKLILSCPFFIHRPKLLVYVPLLAGGVVPCGHRLLTLFIFSFVVIFVFLAVGQLLRPNLLEHPV